MKDPFKTLGVARSASEEEIKGAYRRLAKKYHPDFHENALRAAERFQEIQSAYEQLKKKGKRDKNIRPAAQDKSQTWTPGPDMSQRKDNGPQKNSSIFNFGFWGNSDKSKKDDKSTSTESTDAPSDDTHTISGETSDASNTLKIGFLDAVNGADKKLVLPDGKRVNLRIPPGTKDGQNVRLKRKGDAADILLSVEVAPHPYMERRGDDIVVTLPVSLSEAILGARIRVPTRDGDVVVKIPAGSNTGTILRLKGKGLPKGANGRAQAGDQLLELSVVLPNTRDKDLVAFVQKWAATSPYDPRKDITSDA